LLPMNRWHGADAEPEQGWWGDDKKTIIYMMINITYNFR
jgi:hypothetical protein